MFKVKRMHGEWICTHSSSIMKCLDCNLIYCGECHNNRIKQKFSNCTKMVRCCPKCMGFDIHKISFDNPGNIKSGKGYHQ